MAIENFLILKAKCPEHKPLRLFLVVRRKTQPITIHQEGQPDQSWTDYLRPTQFNKKIYVRTLTGELITHEFFENDSIENVKKTIFFYFRNFRLYGNRASYWQL